MVPGEIGHLSMYREVTGTPREVYGPYWAIVGERRREQRRGRPPFPSSFLPLPSLLIQLGKGGILLPMGVGLPMGRAIGGPALPLLHSFIYRGGGHPINTQVDP